MVDLHWKSKIPASDMSSKSPKLSLPANSLPSLQLPFRTTDISPAPPALCAAYDYYLSLPQLRTLWNSRDFPNWNNEPILKPALQALEVTFRFLSIVFSDPRPHSNHREWNRVIESLAIHQIEIIAMLCEDEELNSQTRATVPTADLTVDSSNNSESRSYSEASLLPRLATWYKSKDVAQRILLTVECQMRRCSYTLGLGEPNLAAKPSLLYDRVCRPSEIHALKTTPYDERVENYENHAVHATHQIAESWIHTSRKLLERIADAIHCKRLEQAAEDCHAVERIWKLLAEVEDLHLMMDPDEFLRLKNQLSVRSSSGETASFCFRSKELVEVTKMCRDLRHMVPEILEVEVDPKGGPRIQEAAMKLYVSKSAFEKVHLLQAMQAIEAAMKRFFYAYKQVLTVVMGSSEANGNRVGLSCDSADSLTQIFLEPTYFPSLDAAKTFLGYLWDNNDYKWP
ncbi:nematode resistance protein-like HSPRO2 [Vigna radiata var. radiata]|uniref:Nematode resistance protein-like HSPRO2 n=1 Tax=Vigna radiata var. radiata TaxID=3916 RepID=A0A1S3TRF0_VIGRR|nr:nematode resistance protein-like HSPRO2 [Vigna radiata var. radiata]